MMNEVIEVMEIKSRLAGPTRLTEAVAVAVARKRKRSERIARTFKRRTRLNLKRTRTAMMTGRERIDIVKTVRGACRSWRRSRM